MSPTMSSAPSVHSRDIPVPHFFPRELSLLTAAITPSNIPRVSTPELLLLDNEQYHESDAINNNNYKNNNNNETKQEDGKNDETRLCCICLENLKCVVLLPCKHLCLCEDCSPLNSMKNTLQSCPICRQSIQQSIKVFL
eukprot:gene5914-8157_t